MVQGKINFIHLREINYDGHINQLSAKGGATIGWRLEENGELTIFKPARCRSDEHYVKAIGRDEVVRNVTRNEILEVIPFETLHKDIVDGYRICIGMLAIGPDAAKKMIDDFVVYSYHNLNAIASNRFYENYVRSVLANNGFDRIAYN